ncbi:hypothetical protein ACFLTH_04125 [Bacteroidota bacterium]
MELKTGALIFLVLFWSLIITFVGMYYYKTAFGKLLKKYKSIL